MVIKDIVIDVSKVVGAIVVLLTAWIAMGGWMPASSQALSDAVKHINQHLAQTDTQLNQAEVNRLIIQGGQIDRELKSSSTPSPFLDEQQRINAEELAGAKNNLFNSQQQQKELNK